MKFARRDDYHARSECGTYSICRVTVRGVTMLEAWRVGTRERPAQRLGAARYAGEEERKQAWKACVGMCEVDK